MLSPVQRLGKQSKPNTVGEKLSHLSIGIIALSPGDSKWPFHPLVGGHLTPSKGSLNHPKKVTLNHQGHNFSCTCLSPLPPAPFTRRLYPPSSRKLRACWKNNWWCRVVESLSFGKFSKEVVTLLGFYGFKTGNYLLGGGFKYGLFSSLLGEMFQFDSYFSIGLKPPTRLCWGCFLTHEMCKGI